MYYAVYPQSRLKNWAADGSHVATFVAPAEQVAYAPGLSKEASVFYARTPGSVKKLNFEPALALVGFTIDESSPLVCAVEVASASGASLAGTFSVDLSAFDPTAPTNRTGTSAKVRLTSFDGECPLEAGTYYIGILPGAYAPGDLSITYTYNNGNTRTEPLTDFPAKIQGGVSYACGTLRPVQESGGATVADPDFKEKVDIYDIFLLIGQSNMAGRGVLTEADKKETVEGVWLRMGRPNPSPRHTRSTSIPRCAKTFRCSR